MEEPDDVGDGGDDDQSPEQPDGVGENVPQTNRIGRLYALRYNRSVHRGLEGVGAALGAGRCPVFVFFAAVSAGFHGEGLQIVYLHLRLLIIGDLMLRIVRAL